MTILKKLIAILGQFWLYICAMQLPRTVCRLISGVFAGPIKNRQRVIQRSVSAFSAPVQMRTAYGQLDLLLSSVRNASVPVTSMTAQELAAAIYDQRKSDWWVVRLAKAPQAHIHLIQDKPVQPQVILVQGIDFYIQGDLLYMSKDPRTLQFNQRYVRITDTYVQPVYTVTGATLVSVAEYNAFHYITNTELASVQLSHALWRVRVQGLTRANLSIICGQILGAPVAYATQPVLHVQQAYDVWYVYTPTHCYSCSNTPIVLQGNIVNRGDALCAGFAVYTCYQYKACTSMRRLQLRTPVGSLYAANIQQQCMYDNILPLQGDDEDSYMRYVQYIQRTYPSYTQLNMPHVVNPARFAIANMFGSSFILIEVAGLPSAQTLKQLCTRLRQECPADSIIYVCDLTTGDARLLYTIIQEM